METKTSDTDATIEAAVGIITRTKDRPVLLKRALESVVNQSYEDWRLVIVNDGGDPAVVDQLVDHYAPQFRDRASVIHNPSSLGMEAASNKGIQSIRTRYLVIHDDDDSWAPEFLTISVAEIEQIRKKFPNVAGVLALANAVYERVEGCVVHIDRTEPYRTSEKRGFVSFDELMTENQFAPIQFLFRYDAAQTIDFFRADLPVLGDWDFNIRFMCQYDVYIIPQFLAFYHHRISDQSVYGNSIIAGRTRHDLYATMLKNEWLRSEINENRIGVGAHIALRQAIHRMEKTSNVLPVQPHTELAKSTYTLRLSRLRNLFSLWVASGQKLQTVKKFFRILFSEGSSSALRQIKLWYISRSGR